MRTKSGAYTRKRKKDFFKIAKGYYAKLGSAWRMVKQQVPRSLAYQYRDRRDKKGVFRRLWITRIKAAVNEYGIKYNEFISGLKKAQIALDRKILAYLAIEDPETFKHIVDQVKKFLGKDINISS
jgi:large subunit ribosomal protein L20